MGENNKVEKYNNTTFYNNNNNLLSPMFLSPENNSYGFLINNSPSKMDKIFNETFQFIINNGNDTNNENDNDINNNNKDE